MTGAWILTCEVDARSAVGALTVGEAFPVLAARQGVADITGGTRAHRPLLTCVVMTRCANRVRTARIWFAQITWK